MVHPGFCYDDCDDCDDDDGQDDEDDYDDDDDDDDGDDDDLLVVRIVQPAFINPASSFTVQCWVVNLYLYLYLYLYFSNFFQTKFDQIDSQM